MDNELQRRLAPIRGKWAEIARIADVDPATIYRAARGEVRDHRIGTYRRISAAIDLVQLRMRQEAKDATQ